MISCSNAPFIPLGEVAVWNEVRSNEAKGEEEDKVGVAHTGGPISFFLKASRFKVRSWKENFRDLFPRNILLSSNLLEAKRSIEKKNSWEWKGNKRRKGKVNHSGSEFIPDRSRFALDLARLRPRRIRIKKKKEKKKKIRFINAADFWTKDRTRPG